jgi:hypothetical protein
MLEESVPADGFSTFSGYSFQLRDSNKEGGIMLICGLSSEPKTSSQGEKETWKGYTCKRSETMHA